MIDRLPDHTQVSDLPSLERAVTTLLSGFDPGAFEYGDQSGGMVCKAGRSQPQRVEMEYQGGTVSLNLRDDQGVDPDYVTLEVSLDGLVSLPGLHHELRPERYFVGGEKAQPHFDQLQSTPYQYRSTGVLLQTAAESVSPQATTVFRWNPNRPTVTVRYSVDNHTFVDGWEPALLSNEAYSDENMPERVAQVFGDEKRANNIRWYIGSTIKGRRKEPAPYILSVNIGDVHIDTTDMNHQQFTHLLDLGYVPSSVVVEHAHEQSEYSARVFDRIPTDAQKISCKEWPIAASRHTTDAFISVTASNQLEGDMVLDAYDTLKVTVPNVKGWDSAHDVYTHLASVIGSLGSLVDDSLCQREVLQAKAAFVEQHGQLALHKHYPQQVTPDVLLAAHLPSPLYQQALDEIERLGWGLDHEVEQRTRLERLLSTLGPENQQLQADLEQALSSLATVTRDLSDTESQYTALVASVSEMHRTPPSTDTASRKELESARYAAVAAKVRGEKLYAETTSQREEIDSLRNELGVSTTENTRLKETLKRYQVGAAAAVLGVAATIATVSLNTERIGTWLLGSQSPTVEIVGETPRPPTPVRGMYPLNAGSAPF